ncbi:ornithine cyclodeaminase family protein [Herbivorax sp. ANBcel31]|uniref:ornithine cyclodeaminase family protein n=1 Tax=Herbivorax sp. ANBcel31 TaxID=3069754 RepID=UPI0027B67C2B|nr:ornithine cyclodeaminase family protein [Herbivorax sp. ANBcel31]MDQ2085654.1 ornithine cyclodeaminase family protein [Herbivorax sp. ANBcel31]
MSKNKAVIILSQKDLMESKCLDMTNVISVTKKALIDFQEGKIFFPDKISQIFNEETQDRINCMPSTLVDEQICGVKWVSVFPRNPVLYNIPNVSGSIILSEIVSGQPIAFMDGSICTLMRTAAISAIAAEYYARQNAETIGIIGSGEQAKMHLIAMKTVRPSLKVCKVASNILEGEQQFEDELKGIFNDVEIIRCNTKLKDAAEGSDIIVTATSAQAPLLKADWVGKGAFYAHVGGWEDEFAVAEKADRIICDDWNAVKHRTQTLSRMYKSGQLSDDRIYADLHELITGKKSGRYNDDEFIYFNSVGLSYVDVALSYEFYKQAVESGKGISVDFQGFSIWNAFKK